VIVCLLPGVSGAGAAVYTQYTDEAAFLAAIGTPYTFENWDGMAPGTKITTQVPGVVFSSPNAGLRNYVPIHVLSSSGARSAPNVVGGGNVRSTATPPEIIVLDLIKIARAFSFYLTDQDPTATDVTVRLDLEDGSSQSLVVSNPHPSQNAPIFFGVTTEVPMVRVTLTSGFRNGGKGGYEAFTIDNLTLGLFCAGDTEPPLCSGDPIEEGGTFVVAGTGTDDGPCDSGIASVTLLPGATNVSLVTDASFEPGDPSVRFTASQTDTALDAQGTVVVTDEAGLSCTLPVSFRALPEGPTERQVICSGEGFLFEISNANPTPAGTSACTATLPSESEPPFPPGYTPSPPEDPFPCRVLTIDSPISGLTEMIYKKDGTFDPRLRLLFSRSSDGGLSFPPFNDVTESVEPILNIDPDPTRVVGTVRWSPVKVACALQDVVDCSSIDPTFDFDQDGFPLCPTPGSGILADCNDQIFSIHPGAPETCNGLDDDCDGIIDEGDPGGDVACPLPDRLGACATGTTACVDGRLVCNQTVVPAPEVCDGIDNDCDGSVDEGLGTTTCGVGACAVTVANCLGGSLQTCTPGTPASETCNGLDDDCDGAIDEGFGPVTCGLGVCARTMESCVGGVPQTCVPRQPGLETCNGLDDDCDGLIDEAWIFGGYLQPVEQDGSGAYHRKQTIPFKFQLTDCAGGFVSTAVATIEVFFYADGVVGTKVKDITSSGQANTDNLYRYDPDGHQYIYNLGTLPLSINTTYLVRTHVSDGATYDVLISIVK
jgi:hypothetical protein